MFANTAAVAVAAARCSCAYQQTPSPTTSSTTITFYHLKSTTTATWDLFWTLQNPHDDIVPFMTLRSSNFYYIASHKYLHHCPLPIVLSVFPFVLFGDHINGSSYVIDYLSPVSISLPVNTRRDVMRWPWIVTVPSVVTNGVIVPNWRHLPYSLTSKRKGNDVVNIVCFKWPRGQKRRRVASDWLAAASCARVPEGRASDTRYHHYAACRIRSLPAVSGHSAI